MRKVIMVGCDLHAKTLVLLSSVDRDRAGAVQTVANTNDGRAKLIAQLRAQAAELGGARIVLAYEASSQGFGLYDQLTAAGIEAHVLAPTRIARSSKQKRNKADGKDAAQLLGLLRAHILAGNDLPDVWVPDLQTRDDRELVRARLDVAAKITGLKAQVKCLLARQQCQRPPGTGKGWTKAFRSWLRGLELASGARVALDGLLEELEFYSRQLQRLDECLVPLVNSARYLRALSEMCRLQGVGALTALVFLTEVGDPRRFHNRRQIAAYLGLIPASHESGSRSDCKGHITRQGPSRVRRVLCQATWTRTRFENADQAAYQRVVQRNPKHKKIAVVATMRRLAIQIWHAAVRGVEAAEDATSHDRGRNQRPQVPPPDPHLLPSLRSQ